MGCSTGSAYAPPVVIDDPDIRATIDEFTMQFDDQGGVEPARYRCLLRLLRVDGLPDAMTLGTVTYEGFTEFVGARDLAGWTDDTYAIASVTLDAGTPISPIALRTGGARCLYDNDGVWTPLRRGDYTSIPPIDFSGNPMLPSGESELAFDPQFSPNDIYSEYGNLVPWGQACYNPWPYVYDWDSGESTTRGWGQNALIMPLLQQVTSQYWRFDFINVFYHPDTNSPFPLPVAGIQVFI